jgi:hypothetical protein
VEYWDTPFTPLTHGLAPHDVASQGLIMDVREPLATTAVGEWVNTLSGVSGSALRTTFAGLEGRTLVDDGRTPNLVGYWSGGAPGMHGASVNRRVGYYFQGVFRSASARGWFSSATSPTLWFAVAGQGYVRMVKNGSDIFEGQLDERTYLAQGVSVTAASTWTDGDVLELVYVQDEDPWGGFVVKAGLGAAPRTAPLTPSAQREQRDQIQQAVVVGAGLFDTGTAPTYVVVPMFQDDVQIKVSKGQAAQAAIRLPLINTNRTDGIGWEWSRTNDATGHLIGHPTGDPADDVTLYRQRLIRVSGGFVLPNGTIERYPLFTGFTDDFSDASTGQVTVSCAGFSQRLGDQVVKNYPDRISYMMNAYRKLAGTAEPVYNVTAFDNWPLELVLRDLFVRAGIDESRMAAPLTVPQADGTTVPVVM